jgi:hypothetical protein
MSDGKRIKYLVFHGSFTNKTELKVFQEAVEERLNGNPPFKLQGAPFVVGNIIYQALTMEEGVVPRPGGPLGVYKSSLK